MQSIVLDRANEAVFFFQYHSRQAMEYVIKHAQTDAKTAKIALNQVMIGYKIKL